MKTIETEHGTVTVDFKEDVKIEDSVLEKAAALLDKSGFESNAEISRIDYKDEADKVIGSITWNIRK